MTGRATLATTSRRPMPDPSASAPDRRGGPATRSPDGLPTSRGVPPALRGVPQVPGLDVRLPPSPGPGTTSSIPRRTTHVLRRREFCAPRRGSYRVAASPKAPGTGDASMKTLVLIKQVPNTDSPFRVNAAGIWVDESNLTFGLNDYDRYALEEALRLKDAGKATEVVALSVGPERAATALRTALATGADRAIHVKDDALAGADPLAIARAIAAAIKDEGFALVIGGLQADDDNYTQTPGLVARLMGRPGATAVLRIEAGDGVVRSSASSRTSGCRWSR